MENKNIYQKLKTEMNPGQFAAATHIDGPARIMAGAGSGKTYTLINRVAYLVSLGADPKRILLLTFTKRAADEMRERAAKNFDSRCSKIKACTYHSFCHEMLREYGNYIGIDNIKIISSGDEQENLIKRVKADWTMLSQVENFPTNKEIAEFISKSVNTEKPIEEIIAHDSKYAEDYLKHINLIKELARRIKAYSWKNGYFSFDDLLVYTTKLLDDPEARRRIAGRFNYIMIDEFQDTNNLQEKMVLKIAQNNPNIVVVGDVSQSIYGFRGSNAHILEDFQAKVPGCKTFVLDKNYRSTQEILDAANKVMNNNVRSWTYYDMHSSGKYGDKPVLLEHEGREEEAEYVLDMINDLRYVKGIRYKDIAVLIRSGYDSGQLEAELTRNGISFVKYGGATFLSKKEVGDILAYLSVLNDYEDELAWFRILSLHPNIGESSASKIASRCKTIPGEVQPKALSFFDIIEPNPTTSPAAFLTDNEWAGKKFFKELKTLREYYEYFSSLKDFHEVFDAVETFYWDLRKRAIQFSGKNADKKQEDLIKLENDKDGGYISVLRDISLRYNNIQDFLNAVMLDESNSDKEDKKENALTISTIHSAKGREWKAVIVLNCCDRGLTPGTEDDEEELRCFYVAMTRAKDNLVLSIPAQGGYVVGGKFRKTTHYLDESYDAFKWA